MVANRADASSLKIIHVLRAPLGGLFRHVLDLAREQISRGHRVGMMTDSSTGGDRADAALAELEPLLALGLLRMPIRRNPHVTDFLNLQRIIGHCNKYQPDIVHGHGSKGGLFARLPGFLPGGKAIVRVYTPHGGSFNYRPGSALHKLYMFAEGMLERSTDLFLFESAFIGKCFETYVGATKKFSRVVLNGISDAEFEPILPDDNAHDFVYVGELRAAKGIDTFIDALSILKQRQSRKYTGLLVGTGPDKDALIAQARTRGVSEQITFPGAMSARDAFRMGRMMIVPSRAESLPYVVLEAAGARIPMIATNVGGIPEIFGPFTDRLVPCDDPRKLADAIQQCMAMDPARRTLQTEQLGAFVQSKFHISDMTDAVLDGYCEALHLPAASERMADRQAVAA